MSWPPPPAPTPKLLSPPPAPPKQFLPWRRQQITVAPPQWSECLPHCRRSSAPAYEPVVGGPERLMRVAIHHRHPQIGQHHIRPGRITSGSASRPLGRSPPPKIRAALCSIRPTHCAPPGGHPQISILICVIPSAYPRIYRQFSSTGCWLSGISTITVVFRRGRFISTVPFNWAARSRTPDKPKLPSGPAGRLPTVPGQNHAHHPARPKPPSPCDDG